MPDFAAMPDAELIVLADAGSGNCTHDAHLGLNTYDCDRCNARRELWSRVNGQDDSLVSKFVTYNGTPWCVIEDNGDTLLIRQLRIAAKPSHTDKTVKRTDVQV